MREQIQRLIEAVRRGRRFVTRDIWHIGKPGEEIPSGFIIKQVRVGILLVQSVVQGALMLRAAALTFATILALVPSLAIMFYIIQTFELDEAIFVVAKDKVVAVVEGAAEFLQPEPVVESEADSIDEAGTLEEEAAAPAVETQEPGPEPAIEETPPDAVPTQAGPGQNTDETLRTLIRQLLFPDTESEDEALVDPVQGLFDMASDLADGVASDPSALLVSIVFLFFTTVLGLMRNIEKSFNHIWGVRRTRPWYRMVGDYMLITILLPFVAAGVLGVTAALQSETIQEELGPLAFGLQGVRYLIIWFVFTALYLVVPNTRVKPYYALLGGVVAGTMWIFLSWLYISFQIGVTRYSLIYSTFAQFPVLLMWIYMSWTILLFGAQLSFAYQNEKTFAMERFAEDASYAYRETLALRAMLDVARRFDEGEPGLSPAASAKELNVPTRLMNDTMENLEEAGLVTACATDPITYQPARALNRLTVAEIVRAMRDMGREPSQLREDQIVCAFFDDGMKDSDSEKTTLADLVVRLHAQQRLEPETIPFKSAEDQEAKPS